MKGPSEYPRAQRAASAWRRVTLVSLAAVLLVLVGTLAISFQPHLHGHVAKYRLLRDLQTAPALRLRFQVKRKAMFVHGASNFEVVAVRDSPERRLSIGEQQGADVFDYHGVVKFHDDDGVVHEYSLVDGTAYYSSVGNASDSQRSIGCIPTGQMPPVHTALSALYGAKSVAKAVNSKGVLLCSDAAATLQVEFAGETFAVCSRSSAFAPTEGFHMYGADLDIEVQFENNADAVWKSIPSAPEFSGELLSSCGKVGASPQLGRPSLGSLFTGAGRDWSHRRLARMGLFDDIVDSAADVLGVSDDSCSCKGTPRPCVFLSGMGSTEDKGLLDTTNYFGSIGEHAPCCTSIKYAKMNTCDFGWNEDSLQQRACDLAIEATGSTGTVIENAIVVTHSMGGLTLGGAIATGKCSLADSSTWVALSAPMRGSMGSNYLQDACAGSLTDASAELLDLFGSCPANTAAKALAYQGSSYSFDALSEQFAAVQAAYAQNVDAVMCSNSFEGLVSVYQVVFALGGAVIPHTSSENDGLVEYGSCAAGLTATFGDSYSGNSFYVTKLNHYDTSFRNGDGLFSDDKKPIKWFECLL
jgi:hypothetical protein